MTQEEKAKAYDEALHKAKRIINVCVDDNTECRSMIACIQELFPELIESEDERTRKAMIDFFKHEREEGVTVLHYGVNIERMIAWLEKQCEKKPADKVKPKFHEGDWVVSSYGKVNQVITVDKDSDGFTLDDDTYFNGSWKDGYHLWTIEDAKDGDVLVYGDNPNDHYVEITMIFKSLRNEKSAFTHFHIFNDYFKINDWCDCGKNVHPATKEQREQLEKAMADAGYEWDAEKKELKKIENEIEIPFGAKDSELQEVTYYIPKGFHAEIDDDKVVIKKGEKSADKVEPFGEYEGLTDFERTLTDICIGWIGEELGWKQYIKDNADVLLKIAIKKLNSVQDRYAFS